MPITGNAANNAMSKVKAAKQRWEDAGNVGDYVPSVGTKADYDKLIAAVKEATAKNESQAALESRIKSLGAGVVTIAKHLSILG